MSFKRKLVTIATSFILTSTAFASDIDMNEKEASFLEFITPMLAPSNLAAYHVNETSINDYYEVLLLDGRTILVNEEGSKGVISMRNGVAMFDFKEARNISAERRGELTRKYVDNADEYITYKAKDEKHSIVVFADIQCGYCQALHDDIPALNAAGVTVKYLPVPAFNNSDRLMNAAYCSKDSGQAYSEMTDSLSIIRSNAKDKSKHTSGGRADYDKFVEQGINILISSYKKEAVDSCEDYNMSRAKFNNRGLGILGTPAILFEDNELVSGKLSVPAILNKLGQ